MRKEDKKKKKEENSSPNELYFLSQKVLWLLMLLQLVFHADQGGGFLCWAGWGCVWTFP